MMKAPSATVLLLLVLAAPPARAEEAAPRLDINQADAAALEALPAIGKTRARQIVRMRERNGPFRCVEELRAVPRLSDRDFRRLLPLVKVSGKHARSDCAALERRRRAPKRP